MTVKRVSVKGQRWDGKIEIEHGLSANDKVVTSGQLRLNDGSAVTLLPKIHCLNLSLIRLKVHKKA